MMKRLFLVACLVASLLPAVASAAGHAPGAGGTYYLSPTGDDAGPGTRETPWKSLAQASREARAGDTVLLLPGTYPGVLQPMNSGRTDAPIVFRADRRRTALLVGTAEGGHAIRIQGQSHIDLEGLHVLPQAPRAGRWLLIEDASHVRVSDLLMERASGQSDLGNEPFLIRDSEQIRVYDSVLRDFIGGDMAHVYNSKHILFEGNAISHAGHSPLAFSPRVELLKSVRGVVVRGNVFHAGWGRPFEFFGEPNVLFENNIIINAFHGARSAGPEAKMMMESSIVRFNRVFRNWGSPLNLGYYHPDADARNTRWYGNVIDDNPQRGIRIETVKDYVFKNNIFSRNDRHGGGRQLLFRGDASSFTFHGNVFWADGAPALLERLVEPRLTLNDMLQSSDRPPGAGLTLSDVQSAGWRSIQGDQFGENLEVDPRFIDAKRYNHALAPESPLRDAGQHLTRTTTAGVGRVIPLEDVAYFYDGFGIEGEEGDLVAVGSAEQTARVVKVEREARTLTLDRSVAWKPGDPVSLPWAGSAPDIGVYEHGSGGRVSIQVDAAPFVAHPGDPVQLRAVVRGAVDPVSFRWQLGDGTVASTRELTHRYAAVGGYPIRVEVTGADGERYRGTGYVEVEDPAKLEKPLLYTSFDNDPYNGAPDFDTDAGNWWRIYYKSRPTTEWKIDFDAQGNGAIRLSADADVHPVAFTAHPAGWRIDQYPMVKFRYRVGAGLPLGVAVQAFSRIGQARKIYVALAPGARPAPDERVSTTQVLQGDGQWHEAVIDVRSIRERYPDVEVLELLRFEAVDPDRVKRGDFYWLDEVSILPERADAAAR